MEKIKKTKEKIENTLQKLTLCMPLLIAKINIAYADSVIKVNPGKKVFTGSGGNNLNELTTFLGDWLTKIGGIVMLIGGITFAFGFSREDAEAKTRGLQIVAAGGLITALRTYQWVTGG